MTQRHKFLSPILSASLEPIKLISLLFVVESHDKMISIAIITIATLIGNYMAIQFADYWPRFNKKGKTNENK